MTSHTLPRPESSQRTAVINVQAFPARTGFYVYFPRSWEDEANMFLGPVADILVNPETRELVTIPVGASDFEQHVALGHYIPSHSPNIPIGDPARRQAFRPMDDIAKHVGRVTRAPRYLFIHPTHPTTQ